MYFHSLTIFSLSYSLVSYDLIPNGSNIAVTEENKEEYLQARLRNRFDYVSLIFFCYLRSSIIQNARFNKATAGELLVWALRGFISHYSCSYLYIILSLFRWSPLNCLQFSITKNSIFWFVGSHLSMSATGKPTLWWLNLPRSHYYYHHH